MSIDDPLLSLLHNTRELEGFFHEFIERLVKRRLESGEDVTHLADEFGLKIPSVLEGTRITWVGGGDDRVSREAGDEVLALARPGQFDALGFTIGCIRVGRFTICLECGWIYCRIVIKGRF